MSDSTPEAPEAAAPIWVAQAREGHFTVFIHGAGGRPHALALIHELRELTEVVERFTSRIARAIIRAEIGCGMLPSDDRTQKWLEAE